MSKRKKRPKRRPDGLDIAKRLYEPAKTPSVPEKPSEKAPDVYRELFGQPALSKKENPIGDGGPVEPVLPGYLQKGAQRSDGTYENGRERVPFNRSRSFRKLRSMAIAAGREAGAPFQGLFGQLLSCEPCQCSESEESRGASYEQLSRLASLAGLSNEERQKLFHIAEHIGLSDRFAAHLIRCLKQRSSPQERGEVRSSTTCRCRGGSGHE